MGVRRGTVDAAADREAAVLRVHRIHGDNSFTPAVTDALGAELEALASGRSLTLAAWP